MKEEYTDLERQIIKYIVENKDKRILSRHIFEKFMDAVAIELTSDKKFVIIVTGGSYNDNNEFSIGEKSILSIITAIDYLIDNNYVRKFSWNEKIPFSDEIDRQRIFNKEKYKFTPSNQQSKTENLNFNELIEALKANRYSRMDKENKKVYILTGLALQSQGYIYDFLEKHFSSFLFPSSSLIKLYKNKFRTTEQIKFRKQRRDTWWGIGLAMFLGLVSICLSIWTLHKDTKIEKDQLNSIINAINENKAIVSDTIKTYIINDTAIKMESKEFSRTN